MELKNKVINYVNQNEPIEDYIEKLIINNYVEISKLNFPNSLKSLKIELLKESLLNLPFSLEKLTITKGCKCCLDKSKIQYGCEVNLVEDQSHDFQDKTFAYATNYNVLRIMSGMSGLNYSN